MDTRSEFVAYQQLKKSLEWRFLALDEEYEGYDPYNHTGSQV